MNPELPLAHAPTAHQLVAAVRAGDLAKVRALLDVRPELVNLDRGEDEHRAIHFAVMQRSAELTRILMEHGADARKGVYPHRDATSALTLATDREFDEIVAIIRGEEARRQTDGHLPVRSAEASGPLLTAVREGQTGTVTRLLDLGHDPNERLRVGGMDEILYTAGEPLYECVRQGNLELARILIAHGADPNANVYASGTPLFRAYADGAREFIELFERHGGFLDAASAGYACQTEAARRLLADEAEGRLRLGAVTPGKSVAEELLWSACGGGDPEIVRMALARIDWPREDSRWHWSLWQAFTCDGGVERGLACFRQLLERASPDLHHNGRTILHTVMARGGPEHLPFAELLLDAGARLDRRDELLESTPLGWACRWGRAHFVKLLLRYGADPVERDAEPWARPEAWARKRGHLDILPILALGHP